jgi:hypothetical protein
MPIMVMEVVKRWISAPVWKRRKRKIKMDSRQRYS